MNLFSLEKVTNKNKVLFVNKNLKQVDITKQMVTKLNTKDTGRIHSRQNEANNSQKTTVTIVLVRPTLKGVSIKHNAFELRMWILTSIMA